MLRIILSRTDSIGDVILSLPMAGIIRREYPDAHIYFLGKTYTEPIINQCAHIDTFLNWDLIQKDPKAISYFKSLKIDIIVHVFPNKEVAKLAYKAKIPKRIGTLGRIPHLLYCNKRVYFTRKNSPLHESQLNLKLLKPFCNNTHVSLEEIVNYSGWKPKQALDIKWSSLLHPMKKNVILHPKSQGSAVEWGLENFSKLIQKLPQDEYQIFITGTEGEAKLIGDNLPFKQENVHSLLGQMTLTELVTFIGHCDAIVAASTGPLHIGGVSGIQAIGLFSSRRPIHPGRWQPIGPKASAIVFDEDCPKCKEEGHCGCISLIKPEKVVEALSI